MNAKGQSGLTLMELLVAGLVLSVVFLGAASFSVSSFKFFQMQKRSPDVNSLIALEHMTRKVKMANEASVDGTGKQLTLRIEKTATDPPTADPADDDWVVYRFLTKGGQGSLCWKTAAASGPAPNVTASDSELVPGLPVAVLASNFELTNPSAAIDPTKAGSARLVKMDLTTQEGAPPVQRTFTTSVMPGGDSK